MFLGWFLKAAFLAACKTSRAISTTVLFDYIACVMHDVMRVMYRVCALIAPPDLKIYIYLYSCC